MQDDGDILSEAPHVVATMVSMGAERDGTQTPPPSTTVVMAASPLNPPMSLSPGDIEMPDPSSPQSSMQPKPSTSQDLSQSPESSKLFVECVLILFF